MKPTPRPFVLAAALSLLLAACSSTLLQPDSVRYGTPEQYGIWAEQLRFRSGEGIVLDGWFLPAKGRALGTVIHFHGNTTNISNQLHQVGWLPAAGYNVLMFDYRGFGDSTGSADLEGAVADGIAAITYVRGRQDVDPQRLVVFGQDVGGPIGIIAAARAGASGIHAVAVEGAFLSYRDVARRDLSHGWLTWAFQYPVAYLAFSGGISPADSLDKIGDRAFLVIHGEADRLVSIEDGRELFDAFPGPDKEFWSVPAGHLEIFTTPNNPWRDKLAAYFGKRLGKG